MCNSMDNKCFESYETWVNQYLTEEFGSVTPTLGLRPGPDPLFTEGIRSPIDIDPKTWRVKLL